MTMSCYHVIIMVPHIHTHTLIQLLAIGLLVATALTVAQLQDVVSHIATVEKRRLNTVGAAAWLVVVSSVGIVLETLFIIIRFCNCDFVRSYRTPLVVVRATAEPAVSN